MPDRSVSTWLADRWHWLVGPWRTQNCRDELTLSVLRRIDHLETYVSTAETAATARLAELAGLIKAEFASLKGQLDAAIADKDAAVAAGITSALNDDSAADASRLEGLIAEFESVLPATVPDVPVPDPGQPAELPAEPAPAEPVEETPPADEPTPPAA